MSFNVATETLKGRIINALLKGQQEAVAGAAADTNIAVAGITTDNTLLGVWNQTDGIEEAATITSNGNIQCAAITTGDTLTVTWA